MTIVLTVLFILICPLLIFIVLVQDPKGGGLAGALGGAGGSSAFGAKTTSVVMKVTVALGLAFFLLALVLAWFLRSDTVAIPSIQENAPLSADALIPPAADAAAPTDASDAQPAAPADGAAAPAPADVPAEAPAPDGAASPEGAQ